MTVTNTINSWDIWNAHIPSGAAIIEEENNFPSIINRQNYFPSPEDSLEYNGIEYIIKEVSAVVSTVTLYQPQTNHYYYSYSVESLYLPNWKYKGNIAFRKLVESSMLESKDMIDNQVSNPFAKVPLPFEKQIRHSYRKEEEKARCCESTGMLDMARLFHESARSIMLKDMELEAEEKAMELGNVLPKNIYEQLSTPDKTLWQSRGIRNFQYYVQYSQTHFWYEEK